MRSSKHPHPLLIRMRPLIAQCLTPNRHRWPCAKRNGVTHIAAHTNSNAARHRAEEGDLLVRFITASND